MFDSKYFIEIFQKKRLLHFVLIGEQNFIVNQNLLSYSMSLIKAYTQKLFVF